MFSSSSARFGFASAASRISRIRESFSFSMSVNFGENRMSFILWISSLRAVRFSWSFGVRAESADWSRLRFSFRSDENESRNSSHSSMMSMSVFGFLPSIDSIWYFIELKIRTSAFA